MPLYSYIACYRGQTHVGQDRRSNYHGFSALLLGEMLPGLSKSYQRQMADRAFRSHWEAVPNRANVWRTRFDLDGTPFELFAVQTEA